MEQRTLWDAVDRDRRRSIGVSFGLLALAVVVAVAVWLVVVVRSVAAYRIAFAAIAPLAAILLFPLVRSAREARVHSTLGTVPVGVGMAPATSSALYDASIAAGLDCSPPLALYESQSPNVFMNTSGAKLKVSVSSAFAALPEDEQRAGLAMLLGRRRVDVPAFAAAHQLRESMREDPVPPWQDLELFQTWIDAATAGDREALLMLGEPEPMIRCLERLATLATDVGEFAVRGDHDAVFGFLAWPYTEPWRAADLDTSAEELPPKAAVALGAFIAAERMNDSSAGLFGFKGGVLGNAQALRAARLREMAGAEGAVAGFTSGRGRASGGGAERASDPGAAAGLPSQGASPASGPALRAALAEAPAAAAASTRTATSVAPAASVARVTSEPVPRVRIHGHCSACGAENAPANRECVVCGARLPGSA